MSFCLVICLVLEKHVSLANVAICLANGLSPFCEPCGSWVRASPSLHRYLTSENFLIWDTFTFVEKDELYLLSLFCFVCVGAYVKLGMKISLPFCWITGSMICTDNTTKYSSCLHLLTAYIFNSVMSFSGRLHTSSFFFFFLKLTLPTVS